ncbi:hypothetical protein LP085_03795 [Achromobacter sp. MY14]|uniref:hypothetical protein n=1 Tax=unclassified Achromobacter TaxID=2626865 RepID=UPI001E294DF3|nr:hypothetical protein [Achromobacter sp. MY14]MCD0495963.1 hypothetical protein [Achromobacter sp. MY14]
MRSFLFSEAVEAHCKRGIVAARGVAVSSARPPNAMDFYEIEAGPKNGAKLLASLPASSDPTVPAAEISNYGWLRKLERRRRMIGTMQIWSTGRHPIGVTPHGPNIFKERL